LPGIGDEIAGLEAAIINALGIPWQMGRRGHIRCPLPGHDDRRPSFRLTERGYICSCGHGDYVALTMAMLGVPFADAAAWLRETLGLRPDAAGLDPAEAEARRQWLAEQRAKAKAEAAKRDAEEAAEAKCKAARARELWRSAVPIAGTLAETYLRGRAIEGPYPPSLRYLAGHRQPYTGLVLPCMVAAVQAPDGAIVGVQRTWLAPDGNGKARLRDPRLPLGDFRACAVRLGPIDGTGWGVCEGTETGLSVQRLFGISGIWCALGTGNMPNIEPPAHVDVVTIFADNGPPGQQWAAKAAEALHEKGRAVMTRKPPAPFGDFNSLAQERAKP